MTVLGTGSFGVVKLEEDPLTGRQYAVKYVDTSKSPGLAQYFEPKAMALSEHENVVKVFHADVVDDELIIRMEYLAGGSVQDRYLGYPAPVRQAIQVVEDACRGVHHLHSQGLLHRDIKPANLLFAEGGQVKVSDFGLAGMADDPATLRDGGYVPIRPPECWAKNSYVDSPLGDVYALGGTAYRLINGDEMLYGAFPSDVSFQEAVLKGEFPDRRSWQPYVHLALRRAIVKAMHVDPQCRFSSAAEFRLALTKAQPRVSWEPDENGGWAGLGIDSFHWAACFEEYEGRVTFILRRGKNPAKLREVRAERFTSITRHIAEAQAGKVLQRVARRGA